MITIHFGVPLFLETPLSPWGWVTVMIIRQASLPAQWWNLVEPPVTSHHLVQKSSLGPRWVVVSNMLNIFAPNPGEMIQFETTKFVMFFFFALPSCQLDLFLRQQIVETTKNHFSHMTYVRSWSFHKNLPSTTPLCVLFRFVTCQFDLRFFPDPPVFRMARCWSGQLHGDFFGEHKAYV